MHIQRHTILIGMGKYGRQVLQSIPEEWSITIIDKDSQRLEGIPDKHGKREITKMCADASSRLVLQEANLNETTILAILTCNDVTNAEILRLAREDFQAEEIFILQNQIATKYQYDNIHNINVSSIISNRIANQMKGTLAAENVGQERGEIRQLTVLNSSGARGVSLRNLAPKTWLIAAIYRDEQLIIPHGDTTILAGDQMVIVGEPSTLDSESSFLQGGKILFPTQYGSVIGYFSPENTMPLVESLLEKTQASTTAELHFANINPDIHSAAEIRQHLINHEIGLLVLPPKKVSWFSLWGFTRSPIMTLMFNTQIPFLLLRGDINFKKILLCVKEKPAAQVLGTVALDITRQFDGELTVLSVYPPNIDKSQHDEIAEIPDMLEQLARSHRLKIAKQHAEGNPIREIQKKAEEFDLVLIGYSQHNRSTLMNPDISLHMFHYSPCSVLFVPWQTAGR